MSFWFFTSGCFLKSTKIVYGQAGPIQATHIRQEIFHLSQPAPFVQLAVHNAPACLESGLKSCAKGDSQSNSWRSQKSSQVRNLDLSIETEYPAEEGKFSSQEQSICGVDVGLRNGMPNGLSSKRQLVVSL
jgi:hypothetical protein